jgi:NAD(P)H-hydrate epimerase
LPEAILHADENEQVVSRLDWNTLPASINAVAIGPGLGTAQATVNVIKEVLDSYKAPLIIDADALNMLADNKTWLAFLPPYSILTPHLGEFERLAGPSSDHFERIAKAKAFAERYQVILILKGHHTLISLPDGKQFFSNTGNSGMATAGSGDTLTGLLLSLLAQRYNPVETAIVGVYLHGLAGDLYIQDNAPQSLIASDLPKFFGKAFLELT